MSKIWDKIEMILVLLLASFGVSLAVSGIIRDLNKQSEKPKVEKVDTVVVYDTIVVAGIDYKRKKIIVPTSRYHIEEDETGANILYASYGPISGPIRFIERIN